MPSSRKLHITPEARDDLREILQYSRDMWGESQRRAYAAKLDTAMQRLIDFPYLGHPRIDIAPDMRAREVGEHLILYRVTEDEVVIVRVLHQKMDIPAQFKP